MALKKNMLSLKLVPNFPRCRGRPRGPLFSAAVSFSSPFPRHLGGETSEPRYERMHKTPAKRPLMNKNVTTMDDSYTHSFHMFPQQLWCAMIYWELLMVCLLRFLPPNSQYGDDRISAGFGVPHRLHLENAQRENSEVWSSRTRKKNGND